VDYEKNVFRLRGLRKERYFVCVDYEKNDISFAWTTKRTIFRLRGLRKERLFRLRGLRKERYFVCVDYEKNDISFAWTMKNRLQARFQTIVSFT